MLDISVFIIHQQGLGFFMVNYVLHLQDNRIFVATFNRTLSQEQASLSQDVLVSKRITSVTSDFQGDL